MAATEHGFVVIGAQSVGFSITNLRTLKELERGKYPVAIGEDIFAAHQILPETVDAIVAAFTAIQQLFADYGVKAITVSGSHSFFEAQNAQFVWDQLLSRTGWAVQPQTLAQESFYRTQAVFARFPHFSEITKTGTVLIDISSGSVELTAFTDGEFGFSRNLSLGPLRVYEVMSDLQRTVNNYVEVMQDYIDSRLLDFMRLLPHAEQYPNMILMGSALSLFETLIPTGERMVETDRDGFDLIYREVTHSSDQYLSEEYDLPINQVEQVLPTVLLLYRLVKTLNSQRIFISNLKLLDGLEADAAWGAGFRPVTLDPTKEIIQSAQNLADRYQVDVAHRDATVTFVLQLFDRLKKLHGLGKRERLLLQIAATINDIGSYVDTHKHYEHSDYIIRASELMGLTRTEQEMVATIARYHSSDLPQLNLGDLPEMGAARRLIIAKLSALLRVADSLDASRQQKITALRVSLRPDAVVLTATASDDIALERWTLQQKGKFFTAVFGLPIELKGRTSR
ncbi:exopolyphosphatase [Lacticaseibacillus nasuensis]|uniref:Exopolyphosphatase n=2 Tax=Lacticaseibacillus TaxID=2759736 RepID=A0A0R1JGQ6_9LACO|nr:exopolyphosphatase [Lacticaseibacillus nasuensis]KRK70463.1 exopolyphosphatase [Lacticaseibacillus nasuensis JCM 17158]